MKNWMVDFSLLHRNAHFRAVFVARLMSVFALGILTVAVPVQIHALTGSALQVGVALALDGAGMFIGLMAGGVLADRHDRRRLILLARALCGIGFLALAANGFLASPSVLALYLVSFWDGFFGAMGITALMAAIPGLVGRGNLPAAGALTMLVTRFGAVIAPAVGGLVIAGPGVSWNYLLAGIGTLGTLIPLTRLPALPPEGYEPEHPLKALAAGFAFLWQNPVVGAVVAVGTLQTLLSAVRVVFPDLASASACNPGLLYSAVPLGAMAGAFTSGWVGKARRPGLVMLTAVTLSGLLVASLGLHASAALLLITLALLGWAGSVASLLQFTLVQSHTPDHLLGRINSLWNAQDVIGDSGGALGMGVLARAFAPFTALFSFGIAATAAAMAMSCGFSRLRALGTEEPDTALVDSAVASESANP